MMNKGKQFVSPLLTIKHFMVNFFSKAVSCVLIYLMSFFSVHGQSYEAKYKMVYGTGPKKEISDTLTSIEELFKSLPIKIVIIYTVTTDGNYLLLNGKQEESLSTIGVSININLSDTEVIFDLRKGLVYFPESDKYQKIKKYKLHENSAFGTYTIENLDSSYFVELNDSLKRFVTPGIFFSDIKFGIQKVHTPDFTIELWGPVIRSNKKLFLESYFKKSDKEKIMEEYSFFGKN
jgi:hypothetical protein